MNLKIQLSGFFEIFGHPCPDIQGLAVSTKPNIIGQITDISADAYGPDRLELIIFVIINKKIDNHPSRLITAKSIMHYRFSSALYW